jgi:hypothetical protein
MPAATGPPNNNTLLLYICMTMIVAEVDFLRKLFYLVKLFLIIVVSDSLPRSIQVKGLPVLLPYKYPSVPS